MAVSLGFHTTPLPYVLTIECEASSRRSLLWKVTIMHGVYARLPAMAVKLNGVTDATNPSSDRYRIKLRVVLASSLIGLSLIHI